VFYRQPGARPRAAAPPCRARRFFVAEGGRLATRVIPAHGSSPLRGLGRRLRAPEGVVACWPGEGDLERIRARRRRNLQPHPASYAPRHAGVGRWLIAHRVQIFFRRFTPHYSARSISAARRHGRARGVGPRLGGPTGSRGAALHRRAALSAPLRGGKARTVVPSKFVALYFATPPAPELGIPHRGGPAVSVRATPTRSAPGSRW